MKKVMAICLALMLLVTAAAAESSWGEGLGPQKPYVGSPEVNLDELLGYMMMMPVNGGEAMPGMTKLQIYLPREDVQVGEGTIKLYSKADGLVSEIDAKDMVIRPMTEKEKTALIWGGGVVAEIPVDALENMQEYYVMMTEGCITDLTGKLLSSVIDTKDLWAFSTNEQNFVADMSYVRTVEEKEKTVAAGEVQAGDAAKVSITLTDEGAMAAVYCETGSVMANATYLNESGELIISFPEAGETTWGIVFMDAEGATEYMVSYTTTVAEKAE